MKTVEGNIIKSDLSQMDGFSYGTITIRNDEIQFDLRITKDTVGEVPPTGSIVRVEYEGDVFLRAMYIEVMKWADPELALAKTDPLPIPEDQFYWPDSCASCGSEESLTKYDYVHTSTESSGVAGYPTYSKKTITHSLPVTGYLCADCKKKTEEKLNRPANIVFATAIIGIALGFIFPFIPGFLEFELLIPGWNLYGPTLLISVLYIIVAGIPSLLCMMISDKKQYPFLEYIHIYASNLATQRYKIVLSSPDYKERFLRFNNDASVSDGAGFRKFTFDYEMVCAGICCFGGILPIIAVFIYHLIMG